MADEVPFKQERKCVSALRQQKEPLQCCLEINHGGRHALAVLGK